MDFSHSDVLFCGDDGLSLEFNIQNTITDEKCILRDMIEHGGGLCSDNAVHSDSAMYLVSSGTRVINIGSNKRLISSKYIFDCVRQNYLLDTDDYRVEVNEMETSDISDNSADLVDIAVDNANVIENTNVQKDDDNLSQSYTVSSSADVVSSKSPTHNTSAEIFDGSPDAPDSASQLTENQALIGQLTENQALIGQLTENQECGQLSENQECGQLSESQEYIRNLEQEVEQILQKPSPKSIEDKIVFVKYICCVRKLAPAKVLQTLQSIRS